MIYIVITIIFCMFVASKNNDYSQIIYFCTCEIILKVIILVCLLYQYCQFIEAENKAGLINEQSRREIEVNLVLHQSTFQFVIAFANQSQYLWIKIILFYCSLCLLMLNVQVDQSSLPICLCHDSMEDQYIEFNYSELKCLLEKDCRIEDFETSSFPYLTQLTLMDWPIIVILLILLFARVLIMPLAYCIKKLQIIEYQYSYNSAFKQRTLSSGSFISGSIIFSSLVKLIVLSLLMILTKNSSCYVLVASNIFYHILIAMAFNQIKYTINFEQALEEQCYQNSQILIDSILWMNNLKNAFFQFGLLLCLIFTTVGQSSYQRSDKSTNIMNYDIFIEFDCGIFQFIMLTILIYKYIIYQKCNKSRILIFNKYYHGSNQELSTNQSSFQNQSMLTNSRIPTQPNNATIIHQQGNLLKELKFASQELSIYKAVKHITTDIDCLICLEQLTNKSANVVSLKCHHLHMFHMECIKQWFQRHTTCPTCKHEFFIN
ncbi:unnamed protein product (macronuclear) [Paramecium tetraurelia]|uniref:RING-type domain-containing protein n=1 Tax=Paramecium tetraurelia TaxID=5888 RepID=A0BFU7_PARTE|nr:uncharacterized protein GSPATT00028449001 [Paramecium tetraurelia]CAK57414.1 unnamed protein product [Paramecium tetraurelia]|eukprot:XP_001424812.1 hypothetical protein (macronuclear) [Paramecium tetraurelia strain d4-2]